MRLNEKPPVEFTTALDDYAIAAKYAKEVFYTRQMDTIYHKSDSGTNLSNLRMYYFRLLQLYYELVDFENFVKQNIVGKLLKYERSFLLVPEHRDRYQYLNNEFAKAVNNTKLQTKSEMATRFPKKRNLEVYPEKTFTDDIVRAETPQKENTILCSPIAPAGGQMLETTLEFETSKELVPASVENTLELSGDDVALRDGDSSDSNSFFTARTQPTGPIIMEIDKNDITTYIQQQSNFVRVRGTLADKPENVEMNKIVLKAHDVSLPNISDPIDFPTVGLPNLWNTCYMASVIQCIFRISHFQKLMLENIQAPENAVTCISLLNGLYLKMLQDASATEIRASFTQFTKVFILFLLNLHFNNHVLIVRKDGVSIVL